MNTVALIGRLVQDPELRYTTNGTAVASGRIAVDGAGAFISESEGYESGFFNVVVWGKQAENFAQYCYKGREIAVEGRLQQRSYESKGNEHVDEGTRIYVIEINANRVQFLREPQGAENAVHEPPREEPPKQANTQRGNGGRNQQKNANTGRNQGGQSRRNK